MNLDVLEAQARVLLRTVGPRVAAAQDEQLTIRRCRKCTPDPPVFRCPICGLETTYRARIKLHYATDPLYCQAEGERRARLWARKV